MANLQFNTKPIRKNPINRNNLFYSEESYQFEMELGRDYLEQDVNQTVILYQVDLTKTNIDTIYGEYKPEQLVFKTPVELHVLYEIDPSELRSYDKSKNLGTYIKDGKLKFGVYQFSLDELGAEIKNGDFIGIMVDETTMRYFVVTNDGRNNFDNAHSMNGYKPAWRSVECAPVSDKGEFNG
jgi:hypothetical protein